MTFSTMEALISHQQGLSTKMSSSGMGEQKKIPSTMRHTACCELPRPPRPSYMCQTKPLWALALVTKHRQCPSATSHFNHQTPQAWISVEADAYPAFPLSLLSLGHTFGPNNQNQRCILCDTSLSSERTQLVLSSCSQCRSG